jgi:predicted PurR-regulated permease PerM
MDKVISTTLKVIAILLVVWLLYFLRDILAYFLLAFLVSAALRPSVDYLASKKIPRIVGGIIIFLFVGGIFVLIISLALPLLISEIQNLVTNAPQYFHNLINLFPKIEKATNGMLSAKNLQSSLNNFFQTLSHGFTAIFGIVSKFFGGLFNIVFIAIITFFLTIEKDIEKKISKFLFSENKKLETKFFKAWERAGNLAGRWLQGYLIAGTVVGFLVYLGLTIIGVKYALIFAFLAGILEIIPSIGPILAALTASLFALSQGGIPMALWTVIVFLAVQSIQNFLITPFVMKNRVYLHPILVFTALFIGVRIAGTLGAILAVPVTAIILAILRENYPEYIVWSPKERPPLKLK